MMKKLLLFLSFTAFLYACDNQQGFKNLFNTRSYCDYCEIENFIYPTSFDSNSRSKTTISEPVAIEFFHVYDTLGKTINARMDSLPDMFIYRDMSGRQLIQNELIIYFMEQNSIYGSEIQPFLDSLKVKRVKGNFKDSNLTFEYNNKPYTVDITYFKDNDGVIFYTPGKKPIYWKQSNFKEGCQYKDFAKCTS